jgi:CheY-like chemotaxis protein
MSHKLLLADDSVTIQRVVELTFADQDVQVLAVGDGEQAIARIPVDQPDIVLADIGMPKRSGYDVAAFVKNSPELRHIPVLLLAGAFEPVDEARAEQVGCNGVLVKPFEPQHVIARVRELLGGATGTPAQATPDMGRPVERLQAPRMVDVARPPETEPPSDPATQLPSDPATQLPSDPATQPPSDPATQRPTDSATGLPSYHAAEMPEFQPGESLDDYFARLGAALESPPPAVPPERPIEDSAALDDARSVPTLEDVLGTSLEAPEQGDADRNIVADAFTALLAVEQGEPGATPVRLAASTRDAPVITETLVDEIARRVLGRLAPDMVRQVVAEVVSEVAERLVREEIQRVRGKQ